MVIPRVKKIVKNMDRYIYGKRSQELALQMAAISGFLFGISAIFYKLAAAENFSIQTLLTPYFIIGALFSVVAGLLLQVSLKNGRTSVVFLVSTAFGATIPVIGGLMLGEILKTLEILGVVLIIVGMLVVARNYKAN